MLIPTVNSTLHRNGKRYARVGSGPAAGYSEELWRLRALRRFQRYAKNLTPYQRKDKRSYPHHIIADLARTA